MNKTFRGRLANGGTDRIRLSTNNGLRGYRMIKFQIISNTPGAASNELTAKVFTLKPAATVDAVINFSDPTLIGVATYENDSGVGAGPNTNIIFDNVIFNQDIFITAIDTAGSGLTNYHIELEEIPLDVNQATVATLKDMRGRE